MQEHPFILDRETAENRLQQLFGIDHFYDEQWQAISRILSGERVLMIERTGFGKSLCYEFPATQFEGITIVFSPLIALMRDQVKGLNRKGISAAYINSEQTVEENNEVIRRALNGEIKILYIAPERQENESWIEATQQMNLAMVVIDEAHTISVWGHDFRPAFRKIINLVKLLPAHLPVLATTATATQQVQEDIEKQIGGRLTTIRGSLIRPNFELRVIRVTSEDDKMIWLAKHLRELQGMGLIYTGTRVDTEMYARWLQYVGIEAVDYNAGLDAGTRKLIEDGLLMNRWKCVISTNALGMGLDKSDIRFVVHTQIPISPIHYYQEIGRAGRDGKQTQIILFYNESKIEMEDGKVDADKLLPLSFINGARPSEKKYHKVVDLLKKEPLSEREIVKKGNLKTTQVRTIKYDLIEQGVIKEVMYGKTKRYEYQYNAPSFDYSKYDTLRDMKMKDLDAMVKYVYITEPRMKYLCSFLSCNEDGVYSNCDNTNLVKFVCEEDEALKQKLQEFRKTYFPELELCETSWTAMTDDKNINVRLQIRIPYPSVLEVYKNQTLVHQYQNRIRREDYTSREFDILKDLLYNHKAKKSHITNGVAASYYGVSGVGGAIHRSKYENGGDFPDFLLRLMLKAFRKKFGTFHYDLVLYAPPTHSGNLVRNIAVKFASAVNIPISHELHKVRETQEQKLFQNAYSKQDNIKNAFDIKENIMEKNIILIDDIYDSGATVKEIARMLTQKGAKYITPIVIAKTIGGTPL